ncbi:TPA: dTDP-glucose 4,6-dehydratase [Patescibacteria group bacterium]|uniref:dTDP-glucose 4,6-dehydratase n=1 Tax=Candidatus Gottesmanbacteria bacterium GW2011_GWA1_43_11 TaxID=1618436 RepID=A0A0G1ES49_9BACT|nr:MAG: dTDP-glucose 4,6-dehydratase [Candidatus Gottesmanbacteria bacterium GW2011_GWA1_43_11]HCS78360.1 dTDP-glucose 4,6-dehydratase [Patescibacteria group bacterium]
MKLLVTGGAGFIGANFIHFWLRRNPNDAIVNFDALTYAGNLENLRDVEKHPGYSFVKGDITDPIAVNSAMNGVEAIVHFAAESHVDRSIDHPATFVKTNVLGTQVLLDAALKNGVKRFHHISTDEVFGALTLEDATKFSELTPYNPRSPYAASKAGSDHLVRAYFHTYGLATTISNCSNNYGPYQHPEKLIPLAITNLLEGKKVPIYGDGFYVRDWLYVEDHCRAIELILKHGVAGETYCVGGMTENISNRQIISKILQLMDENMSMIEEVSDRPGHDRRYAVDWTKINTQLGWQPQHEFETGLEETINWYMEHKDWWQHVKSGEYKEYYKKQYQS